MQIFPESKNSTINKTILLCTLSNTPTWPCNIHSVSFLINSNQHINFVIQQMQQSELEAANLYSTDK